MMDPDEIERLRKLAHDVTHETLHGPVPIETVMDLATGLERLAGATLSDPIELEYPSHDETHSGYAGPGARAIGGAVLSGVTLCPNDVRAIRICERPQSYGYECYLLIALDGGATVEVPIYNPSTLNVEVLDHARRVRDAVQRQITSAVAGRGSEAT